MKSIFKVSLLAATVAFAVGCQDEASKSEASTSAVTESAANMRAGTFGSEDQKAGYAVGVLLSTHIKQNIDTQKEFIPGLNSDDVLAGIGDGLHGKASLTDEEVEAMLEELNTRVAKAMEEKMKTEAANNAKAGEEFRAKFEKEEGVVKTESGLLYKVMKEAEGPKPKATDVVVVHYSGTLVDGTKFDSSYDREQPATFPLNAVIPGWTEGVQLMNVGSKYKFVIPAELGYGEQASQTIPANSTLVFEVELLEIKSKEEESSK